MKRTIANLAITVSIILVLIGCSSSNTLTIDDQAGLAEMTSKFEGRTVQVTFIDATKLKVSALSVSPDLTSGLVEGDEFQSWPTASIIHIEHKNEGKGAAIGGLVGFVTLGLLGYVMNEAEKSECTGFCFEIESSDIGLAMGLVGLVPGVIIGGINGYRTSYTIDRTRASTQAQTSPYKESKN